MRPIVFMTCLAVLTGGSSVAAIATGQTTVVAPPADPDGTPGDRADPEPASDATPAPASARPSAPVDTTAVTAEEVSVAAEEAAFDTSLSAMAAQLDGHVNGLPLPDDGASAAASDTGQAPEPPSLAAIVTAFVCIVGAIAALAAIARSGIRARERQREEDRKRRRALRRQTPRDSAGKAPPA